ncbi:hypothetical protein HYT59_00430 [Candidatus Woesebacteria bacterium]|nr:hypothetical protein [Candidatus Woesebacteria bacterium]
MKNIKKRLLLPTIVVVSILMVGVLTASLVSAQDSSAYPTIIERLSDRFGLNKDDVKEVFEEVRDEHKAEMYANWAERLDDLVADGKITSDQKQAILDKHEEFENKMEEIRNQSLTFDERKQKLQALHEEFKNWAESQGIDLSLIGPFGKGFKGGFRMGYKMGMMD